MSAAAWAGTEDAWLTRRLRSSLPLPAFQSAMGALWSADCMTILPAIADESVDTVFADPPFNLGKSYGKNSNDARSDTSYVMWCKDWLAECVRVLAPGGALFLYNLPKWNLLLGAYLYDLGLRFRHWIAVECSSSFPISGQLHPSHYSLLYFTNGKPKTFRRVRTPIQTCRHCGREVKDYGGHRKEMHTNGVNLKDVWTDIPLVRHLKFKPKSRRANQLSTKLLDRVVEMSTNAGEVVLDPFGGSGTTYAVCEARGRHWLGMDIDSATAIAERLSDGEVRPHKNTDYFDP